MQSKKFSIIATVIKRLLFKPCFVRNHYANAFCYNRACKKCYEKSLQSDKDIKFISNKNKITRDLFINGVRKNIRFSQPRFMLKKFKYLLILNNTRPKLIYRPVIKKDNSTITLKRCAAVFPMPKKRTTLSKKKLDDQDKKDDFDIIKIQQKKLEDARNFYNNYEIVILNTNNLLFVNR